MSDMTNLLRNVQTAEFALVEANLFLDMHPADQNALDYFRKYQQIYEKAVEAYTTAYGPLTAMQYTGGRWKWTDGPFPWEQAANA